MTPVSANTFKVRVLSFLIVTLLRTYARLFLRIRVVDEAGLHALKTPVIWAFWHNRLLLVPVIYGRFARCRHGSVLTSPSRDGAMLAAIMARFGLGAVRGSSNKRAAQALVECRRRLKEGHDLAITPDGPRGPVYVAAPGIIQLARVTETPVMPIRVEYSRMWQLKSWDRFRIPKPFARVTLTFAPVLHFGSGEPEEEARQLAEALTDGGKP